MSRLNKYLLTVNTLFSEENLSKNPNKKYILKGDRKKINALSPEYLNSIIFLDNTNINTNNINQTNTNNITNNGTTIIFTEQSFSSKNNNQNHQLILRQSINNNINNIKEESYSIDDKSNEVQVERQPGSNMNYTSMKSGEFLLTLYDRGKYHNSINNEKNDDLFIIEGYKLSESNPYLYSCQKLHPFSIFYNTKYPELFNKKTNDLKLPAPYFIDKEEWRKPMDFSYKNIFNGITINDKLGLVISDPIVKNKFSGLIKNIIFQILKVPFGHHISLNVKIFEPKTVQERYMYIFCYINNYILKASNEKISKYERFKLVITCIFAGMHAGSQQLKPFNPFVGETYQGELPNGAKIYAENVSHKPLATRFYIFYKNIYKIYGYFDFSVKSQNFGNEMLICQKGPIYIKFPQISEFIICHLPEIRVVNAISENGRAIRYTGNHVFIDIKNNFKAVIKYDYNEKCVHGVKGCTMKYNFPFDYFYDYEKEWDFGNKFKFENSLINEYEIIENIKGSFVKNLIIGNEEVWNVELNIPEYIRPCKDVIPSDGRFREDLIWLYRSFYNAKNSEEEKIYMNISQDWKVMMEEFNRWERKHRADYKARYSHWNKNK